MSFSSKAWVIYAPDFRGYWTGRYWSPDKGWARVYEKQTDIPLSVRMPDRTGFAIGEVGIDGSVAYYGIGHRKPSAHVEEC